ncbi:MAG: ABC transporter ATP-binding protein [Planctomycetota bacterium]|jgi:ABC-2 type transport system ATP-binding protein
MSTSETASGGAAVETRGLLKDYTDFWGRPKVRALAGLDMEVRRGEVFGLLGPNGSGKTTTMKLVLGLIWPTAGEVKILGRDPRETEVRARIGFLPEETYLHKFLTGEETLEFHGKLFDIPKAERRRRIDALLERVGLTQARSRRIREYSRGMGRRIGLAQALINEPELILLDEPTAGLDPIGTREVKDLIVELRREGRTVVMSSHLLADVEDVCDRIVILHRGRACRAGSVDEILTVRDETRFTARGLSEEDAKEVERLLRAKAKDVRVDRPRETLESVFLREVRGGAVVSAPVGTAEKEPAAERPGAGDGGT